MTVGRASQSGLYGAQLADAGFTGIVNVFESEYGGFCTTFSRSTDRFRLAALTADFGSVWQTMDVRLKFYACIGSSHAALDAVREIQNERPFSADDVAEIVVHASQITVDHVGWKYEPRGLTSAQLNLSYCIAALLIDGEVFVDQFTEAKVADPVRMALAAKVSVLHDPAITAKGSKFRKMVRVAVHFRDGTCMERILEASHHHKVFATEGEVVQKFEKLAKHVLPIAQVEQLRDAVLNLDKMSDVAHLSRLLAKP
jgi:2-methylcitrate dehydratase PrpD